MVARFGIEGMPARLDGKKNPREYGIARNFGSGLRDWRTLLGSLRIMFNVFSIFCILSFGTCLQLQGLVFIWPHCNNYYYSISSQKSNNYTTKPKNYFAFCQRKNVRLSQTWRTLAQTLKGPGLQITRNRTSRLRKQRWSIKNIWVHPRHNLQRLLWSQVKRKRRMFFRWLLSLTFDWPTVIFKDLIS